MVTYHCSLARRVPFSALVLGWMLCVQAVNGQEQQSTTEPREPQKPQPIAAAEIPGRSERTAGELQIIRDQLRKSPAAAAIDSLLPDYISEIKAQAKTTDDEQLARQTLRALTDQQEAWSRFASHLSDWRSTLEARAREIEDIRSSLQRMRGEWEATRTASREEELPAPLRQSIQSVLALIAEHEALLQGRRSDVLALLKRISDESLKVTENLRLIEQTLSEFSGNFLKQDSPPLWMLLTGPEARPETGELSAVNQRKLTILEEYIRRDVTLLTIHLAAGFFLLATLYTLRRKSTVLITSVAGGRAREVPLVLQRPISIALLVMLIITRLSLPEAPLVFFRVGGLILLIPILRLLPLYLPQFYRRVFYMLAGIYLFHRIEALTIDIPILYRLLLLMLTASGIAGLLWFERLVIRHKADPEVNSRRWHMIVSRGAGTLLIVSLIANTIGAVGFAEFLTDGTLNSLYAVMALTAGVLVFGDLFDLLLRARISQTLRMVRDAQDVLSKEWAKILRFAAVLAWISVALYSFNLWLPFRIFVADILADEWTIGKWNFTLGSILGLVLTIWVSVLLSRLVRFALESDVLPRTGLRRGVQSTISTMAYYLVLLAGLVLATSMIGIKWDTIAIVIGALGVGIGFGLQTLVNNVVSGLILMFERPINVGDTIEFGSRFGDVLRIGLRASTVRTFDGSEVIVPNASLVSSEVVNWTLSDRNRRLEISVGVEYGTDPQKVLELLLRAARGHSLVMKVPEPFAWFMGFGESSLDFVLKFWCQFEHAYTTRSELMTAINQSLKEAGIVIPFPQRDLHVRSLDAQITDSLSGRKDSAT